jgi:hydroxymethylpyrimidine/phosphomethylpyrimidine kinase
LDPDAESAYVELLLPHATVATPNSREAAVLTGRSVDDLAGQTAAARALVQRTGARAVVVKGGDQEGDESVDVLFDAVEAEHGEGSTTFTADRLATANNHGTGCSFASAVAVCLARGDEPYVAVARAKQYVHLALQRAVGWRLGAGHGPIDHLDLAHPVADRFHREDPS